MPVSQHPLRPFECRIRARPDRHPLQRLRIGPLPDSGWSARKLADALAAGDPRP